MKVKVLKPQKTVYTSETKEMTLEIDGKVYVIRQHEDDNHGENWVSINDEPFMETYEMEDGELRDLLDESCNLTRSGIFDNEGEEMDSSEILS